jgi:hypothetical protein
MPRARINRLFPVALSPAQAADALGGIRPERVRDLIAEADVPVYRVGMRRLVLVADLVTAIRKHWPKVETKKRKVP